MPPPKTASQPLSPTPIPKWRPLPSFPGLPPLLISAHFSANSYTIHLTDLSTIWTETLDKKGILKRSLTEDTSIDLMDADAEQWNVFLGKLASAFDVSAEGYAGTGLELGSLEGIGRSFGSSVGSGRGGGEGDLVLNITCILPEPLEPLKWPVLLKKRAPSATAVTLTLPLVRDRARGRKDVEDLVEKLREKDVVITKLVDKLEAMGAGLENVFHVLSGKRKTSRAVAEEKVKGLKTFEEREWRVERAEEGGSAVGDVEGVLSESFGGQSSDGATVTLMEVSNQLDDWWLSLGSSAVIAEKEEFTGVDGADADGKKTMLPHENSTKSSGNADDDDFQVQSTPPHLQAATAQKKRTPYKPPKPRWRRDESSEDDDNVSIPDSHPLPPAVKGASQDHSASQSSRTVPVHDDETASSGSEAEAKKPETKAPPAKKGRLGAIGRKQKAPTPEPGPVERESQETAPSAKQSKADSATEKAEDHNGDDGDATASGSDSDASMVGSKSKAAPTSAPAERQAPKRAGLGRIGARSKAPAPAQRQKSPTPASIEGEEQTESPAKATRTHDNDRNGGDDAMDTDVTRSHEGSPAPAVEIKPVASKPAVRKTLGMIGKIGGKKQHTTAPSVPSTSSTTKEGEEAQDAGTKRARNESATPTSASTSAPPKTQVEDEDNEQRAERKRVELAKELEKKAAAPAKKKRRF